MNVSLTPELERLVEAKVKNGQYQTASEVVREGLRLLAERDRQLISLQIDIRTGFDAIERGEYADFNLSSVHKLASRVKKRALERRR